MTITAPPPLAAEALRGLCGGRVHLPGDPGYDAARVPGTSPSTSGRPPWPCPTTSRRSSRSSGPRPPPASGSPPEQRAQRRPAGRARPRRRGAGPALRDDRGQHRPDARTARVVGGTLWQDVVAAAAPYGLAAMHGSAPDVAVAGYALGGGLSLYGRQHGLAANRSARWRW